jgi:hypothetical protein
MNSLLPFERGGKVHCMVIAIRKLLCLFLRISIFGIRKCDSIERMNDYEKKLELVVIPKYVGPNEKLVMWVKVCFMVTSIRYGRNMGALSLI